jgi:hypothetical protein
LFAPMSPSRQSRSWTEHAAILRAIIDGDERLAATLAAEHVMRAGADFMAGLDAIGEEPTLTSLAPASIEAPRTSKANGFPRNRSPASRGAKPEKRSKLA